MFNPTKITATLLLITISGAFSANISAENLVVTPVAARLTAEPTLPKLGFDSQLISGYGEQVTFVEPGSKAFRLGLQPQDVILSVNGVRLTHGDAWQQAIVESLLAKSGTVALKIRVGRTGNIVERQTNIVQN